MNTKQKTVRARIHTAVPLFIILLLLVSSMEMGCSTASKTTRSETETTITQPTDQTSAPMHPTETTTVKKEATTETETKSESGGGALSTIVDVVGEVLALPFRLVGGLIRALF